MMEMMIYLNANQCLQDLRKVNFQLYLNYIIHDITVGVFTKGRPEKIGKEN